MNIVPQNDRILLTIVQPDKQSKGGIFIPDAAQEKTQQGVIQAMGPGKLLDGGTRIPANLQVGNKVLYRRYAGEEVTINGEDYFIVGSDDVLAVLQD